MAIPVQVLLASGRRVWLDQLHILPTTIDWSNASAPKPMDRRLPELVATLYGSGSLPLLMKEACSNILPPVTCIASFESDPMEKRDVAVNYSFLVICWFTEGADKPVRQLVCEGLASVDWERYAQDIHSDW